jgi:hypothetical protein
MADTVHILARYHREADIVADTAHIFARYRREADTRSAEAGQNSAAAHRQHTATGVPTTGVPETGAVVTGVAVTGVAVIGVAVTGMAAIGAAVIGVAIGRVAVTGAAAADSSLSAEVIRTTRIGIHIGAGATLTCTRTTAIILMRIILRIGTLTTVAPYQDSDSLGSDPSWFPRPASPGNCASGIPAVKSHYGSLKSPACSCVSIAFPASS